MGAACSCLQQGPVLAPAPELHEADGPAGGGQGGASEDGTGPAAAAEGPAPPPPPPPAPPGTAPQAGERKALALLDGLSDANGCMVVVSFPGVHQDHWNNLVATAKLMQNLGSSSSWFSSACIFLPEGDPHLGKHCPDTVTRNGRCFCQKLYGEQKPWGCQWFECWREKLHLALERGQEPVVIYKAGEVGEGDAYSWEQFPIGFSTDRRGLGASQAGEVAYLKYYLGLLGRAVRFRKMDVNQLDHAMASKAYSAMREMVHGDEGGKKFAAAIMNCAEAKAGLANFVLSCGIHEAGGLALARALPACSALKRIVLSNNPLGDAAGQAIARALPACAALEAIELGGTGLGEAAGLELARALPAWAALKWINLDDNPLGDAAGQAIARALPACAALETINLDRTGLGEAAGLELARALPAWAALKWIFLYDNPLGDAAGQAIARALPACAALESIDLSSTGLGEAAGLELARALPACAALQRIDLYGNGLEDEEEAAACCLGGRRGRARAGRALRRAAAAGGVVLSI